jgi:hypothetical protein
MLLLAVQTGNKMAELQPLEIERYLKRLAYPDYADALSLVFR